MQKNRKLVTNALVYSSYPQMHLLSAHIFLREETRFKEHYLPLTNDMFALAYRLLQDEDEAKDVVQEVLTKLWQIRSDLPPEGADKAYCLTMVRNNCIDQLRRQQTIRFEAMNEEAEEPFPDLTTESFYSTLEAQDYLDYLLKELPPKVRQIVELRLRDGFSFREIEQLTGIHEGNARVILLRTLKRLRNEHESDETTPH